MSPFHRMKYYRSFSLLLASAALLAQSPSYLIDSIGSPNSDPAGAGAFSFDDIRGLAADLSGNLYVSDSAKHRVIRIAPTGAVRTIAGTGAPGFSGDNGAGEAAQLRFPYGVAADNQGNVYIADLGNARVRRVSSDGVIRTVAGGGRSASAAGVAATELALKAPRNVAVDSSGNIYISDFQDHRVLRVSSDGRASGVAGTGAAGPVTEGLAASAALNYPAGLHVAPAGTVYIADSANHALRRVAGATITTVPVQFAEQNVNLPIGVSSDAAGNLYGVMAGWENLIRITPAGTPTVIAAGGVREVAISPTGVTYYATATQVRRLSASGVWTPVNGGAVTQFLLASPDDVQLDTAAALLIADSAGNRIQRVVQGSAATTVAGTGDSGYSGDGGQAAAARLSGPQGVGADRSGNIFVSDTNNHRIRRVDASGSIRTVAGTGTPGNTYESRTALQAAINSPSGIVADLAGDVYFSDSGNHMIRRLSTAGILYPAAGNGSAGFRGDRGSAVLAQLSSPKGLALDLDGGLLIADSGNQRIRKISVQGVITTVAGNGTAGFSGDGRAAVDANLNLPAGITVDLAGNLYIADTGNQRVRRVAVDGSISTVAGTGVRGFSGDQGSALSARLDTPVAVAAGLTGTLYVADRGNQKIRQLTLAPNSGGGDTGDLRVLHGATLEPLSIAPGMLLVIQGSGIGPATPFSGRIAAQGALETTLGGTQVRFDGVAAPLLYLQDNMIHLQAPYGISGSSTTRMEILRDGLIRAQAALNVAPAAPGIFATSGGSGPAAAINEDASPNSESSPAPRGTAVTFFVTGEGALTPQIVEGRLAEAPYPSPAQPVSVRIGQVAAELISASSAVSAPGLLQVVARVPASTPVGRQSLQVTVGSIAAQASVTLYIR